MVQDRAAAQKCAGALTLEDVMENLRAYSAYTHSDLGWHTKGHMGYSSQIIMTAIKRRREDGNQS